MAQRFLAERGLWEGFEEKLNGIAAGNILSGDDKILFRFMVNDARTMVENGCNFAAALSLLCFTEACGRLYLEKVEGEEPEGAKYQKGFAAFLRECAGCDCSKRFAKKFYSGVRCSLAHSYFLLRESRGLLVCIGATGELEENGFRLNGDTWEFACMPYLRRFVSGLENLDSMERRTPRPRTWWLARACGWLARKLRFR